MISINIKAINDDISSLDNLILDYYDTYINFFHILNDSENYFKDNTSKILYAKVEEEKKSVEKIIFSLKERTNIYKYIYSNYKEIGTYIKVDIDAKNALVDKIAYCINKTDNIVNLYNTIINNSTNTTEIEKQKKCIILIRDRYKNLKTNILDLYQKLSNIENAVKQKIDDLDTINIDNLNV